MDESKVRKDETQGESSERRKLMVSGSLQMGPEGAWVEVRRGMHILSQEGLEIGKIAAVVTAGEGEPAAQVLLSRLPAEKGYWIFSADRITGVMGEVMRVDFSYQEAGELPVWHMEC